MAKNNNLEAGQLSSFSALGNVPQGSHPVFFKLPLSGCSVDIGMTTKPICIRKYALKALIKPIMRTLE